MQHLLFLVNISVSISLIYVCKEFSGQLKDFISTLSNAVVIIGHMRDILLAVTTSVTGDDG